jgi:hypothetical protein
VLADEDNPGESMGVPVGDVQENIRRWYLPDKLDQLDCI